MNDTGPETEKDLSDIQNDTDLSATAVASPYDVPLDDLLSDEASMLTPADIKKLKQIGFGALGVILVLILLSIYGCQPKQGSMAYGICSTFLELNTTYPHTLNYIGLEGSRTAVRIYYTSIDAFGQYKQEMLECKFGPDEKMGMKLTEILKNRRALPSEEVRNFNALLPTIIASDPYLVMPGKDWQNPLLPR